MMQFLNPGFLFALAGLSVPILLHLINREPARNWIFPSVRFIRIAPLPRKGQSRVTDWLLLLLRILFYALMILIPARPQWVPEQNVAQSPLKEIILMVDLSASMSGWNAEDALREKLDSLIDENVGNAIGVVGFANEILFALPATRKTEDVRGVIDSMDITPYPGNPLSILPDVTQMFRTSGQRELIILSDFQESNWETEQWPKIPEGVAVTFMPIAAVRSGNLGIVGTKVYPIGENRVRVVTQLANYSDAEVTTTVTFSAGTRTWDRETSVKAGETLPIVFELDRPNDPRGIVQIPEDVYAFDNTSHVWVGPSRPAAVLAVVPSSADSGLGDELFFLSQALMVHTEEDLVRYQVDPVELATITPEVLSVVDAVILPAATAGLENLPWEALKTFAENGGDVLITLASGASRPVRSLKRHGIMDIDYLGVVGKTGSRSELYHIGSVSAESPLGDVFSDDAVEDLYLVSIRNFVRVSASEKTEVWMKNEAGDPLLLRRGVGAGSFVVSTFQYSSATTDLPIRTSFLPLIREIFADAVPVDSGVLRMECGDLVPPMFAGEGPTNMIFEEAGVFIHEGSPLEVNVSRLESQANVVPQGGLERSLVYGSNVTSSAAVENEGVLDLWPWVAMLAFWIFCLEGFLSGWMSLRSLKGQPTT